MGEQDAVKRFRAGVLAALLRPMTRVGEPLAALLGRHLVDIAGISDGDGVLDVDCGRGAVLILAAERPARAGA